ncbi:hypothetical protein BM526_19095 (plasmid) [Alteromonas mediterranea]|uniref:GNAT family N-acetyltransferase n=1 Tax=Alteromonas mediterranea TaxID=314275 RepID=UPI00090404E7|nr:GNAT family N-acetyltransferase [Alteromonas mediterranea]APE04077.1 hypothetical protein BM526_19095 [Alteromonas mediterranea]
MKAVHKFLEAYIGDSNIDKSTAIFDKWGGVKGLKVYSHCTLTLLNDANGSLGIGNIEVETGFRSSGIGRKTMKMLLDYADTNSVTLTLYARSHSFSPLDTYSLVRWYENMGFIKTPRGHIRKS